MNNLIPQQSKIISIINLTNDTRLFRIKTSGFSFIPGQFVMVSLLGYGEAPISISSSPTKKDYLELTVRKVGQLTDAMFNLTTHDKIFIRGSYGNGFPIEKMKNKNLVIISGGCGLAPMRSLIQFAQDRKNYFKHLQILYGTKTPQDILFANDIKSWKKTFEVILTVDIPDKSWQDNTGLITNLVTANTIQSQNSVAILCGPPVMYQFVVSKLLELSFNDTNIYLSLERKMQCGIGLCQHCTCGSKYVCTDGPVFSLKEYNEEKYKGD